MVCKIGFTNWNAKIVLLCASMVVTYYVKLFCTGANRHNSFLMSLLLLVAETKMKCIGFSNKTRRWFYSYLTNRAFFISLDNELSEAGTINCGVPQGSILGSLLLLLYTIFHKPCQIVTHPCMQMTLAYV